MYRAIIVEDETDIRRGLRDFMDWQAYRISIVFDAANGRDALQYVLSKPVDIIITDVVMPIMDGIELVRKARSHRPSVKALFISGYQDIDYIKDAFRVSAIDYIFKPVDLDELDAVLRRVVAECDRETEERRAREAAELRVRESLALRQRETVARILRGSSFKRGEQEELGLDWMDRRHHVVVAFAVRGTLADEVAARALDRVAGAFGTWQLLHVPTVSPEAFVLTSPTPLEDAEVMRAGEIVLDAAAGGGAESGTAIALGIGHSVRGLYRLGESYTDAVRSAGEAFYGGYNRVYRRVDHFVDEDPTAVDESTQKVVYAVERGRRSDVRPALRQFTEAVARHTPHDPAIARALSVDLLFRVGSHVRSAGYNEAAEVIADLERCGFQDCTSLNEVYTSIAAPLERVATEVAAGEDRRSGFLVEKMKAELRTRLAEGVTIQHLAETFLLSPNHVSRLFKSETGYTVRGYLTKIRIEKAKALLADPRLRLYDIAAAVGYRDRDYLTKTFKRHVGVTPKEYRDRELA